MDDAISRQAVLKLLSTMPPEEAITKAMLIQNVKYMSAAQPEKRTEERTESHACDLISRAAAIERATKDQGFYKGTTTPADKARRDELLNVMCWLGELPSAQPERKRGKWIEDDDGWDEVIWRCSECDAVFTLIDGTPKENEYYFCPHCGADMRGKQDDEP